MNKLTEKLLSEGYTKDNHPDYVEWSNWKDFEYTRAYLTKSVWETPCGLLKNGVHSYSHGSHMGITYCPENNNPRFGCPYYMKPCKHRLDTKTLGWNCVYHKSDRTYEYEKSVEKAWDEFYSMKEQKRVKFFSKLKWNPNERHCSCIKWDDEKHDWFANYDPWNCAHGCYVNDVCVLTGKRLDGKKGNVFYDVKTTRIRKDGSLWDGEKIVHITKGKKMFGSPIPLAICEAYAKLCKNEIADREENRLHRELFLNKDLTIEVLNVRAECRETRDLLQDLRDAGEGIQITHASDLLKAKKEAKSERIKKRKEDKKRRQEKITVKNLKRIAKEGITSDGEPASELIKEWAENQLKKRGITIERKYEQISLL